MSAFVIDTNVLAVADQLHENVSPDCLLACISVLEEVRSSGKLVIDDQRRIITEYLQVLDPGRQDKVGSVFLKWLLNNQHSKKVVSVEISEIDNDIFDELSVLGFQNEIDPPDRKFLAVAVSARKLKPELMQAVDSEWLIWEDRLQESGIRIKFICPTDIVRYFHRKYPGAPLPDGLAE